MNSLISSPKTIPLGSIPYSSNLPNAIERPTSYSHSIHHISPSRSPTLARFISTRKERLLKKCIDKDSSPPSKEEEEEDRALEAVLKLYDAIKNKNIQQLSEIFGDECRCGCNFLPLCRSFRGKKQVLAFFSYLTRSLGSNIEVVVQPTLQDGMTVGVSWRLEWNKNNVPLGKGLSFHICQIYQGKVLIRNVEMIMEPLLHLEPVIQNLMGCLMRLIEKTSWLAFSRGKASKRAMHILLAMLLVASLYVIFTVYIPFNS